MVFLTGGSYAGRLFTLGISLLIVVAYANGQIVDVSLRLRGVALPSDSLVDIDDILDSPSETSDPANNNEYHDQALLCITGLEDCCTSPRTVRGDWYYPDGSRVAGSSQSGGATFRRNRGVNEVVNDQQSYGSVRLFRQGDPPERGRFRCQLPNSANPNYNRTLYAHILDIGAVTVSLSGSNTAGENSTLVCSASIVTQLNTPSPHFQWFLGPRNVSLPFFLSPVMTSSGNTFTSTLQFSPLNQSHAGSYTCRLSGNARLAARTTFIVNSPVITVMVNPSFTFPLTLGQTGTTLTCDVFGADNLNPTIAYLWTRNDKSTQTLVGNSKILALSPLLLSNVGDYTCNVTVNSSLLGSSISVSANNSQSIVIQVPNPESVTITSDLESVVLNGSNVTLNCSVQMNQELLSSNMSLLVINASLIGPDSTMLDLSDPVISGTTFTYFAQVNSFSYNNAGEYTCMATITARPMSVFLTGTGTLSGKIQLRIEVPPTTMEPSARIPQQNGDAVGQAVGAVVAVVIILVVVFVALTVSYLLVKRRTTTFDKQKNDNSRDRKLFVSYNEPDNVTFDGVTELAIEEFPSDMSVVEGEGVYFKIKVSGVPLPTVTWYHDREPVKADYAHEIESDGCLAIRSTELKHSGVYKVVIANKHGFEERELKLTVIEEGRAAVESASTVISRPSLISEFGKYVAELHSNSNKPFKDLYEALDSGEVGRSVEYATHPERRQLNRFRNVVVYDDNRIVLKPLADVSNCQRDYINACYVDGYFLSNKFIVTQGPIPETEVDFWRLIWQERPPTIVMVTRLKEGLRIKCHQYWPESGKKDFGPFHVIITDQQIFADYTIRAFSISLGSGRSHNVTQYHFTAWPDHGVPDYATPILAFHKRVKAQHHPSRGSMVVHCSAGVGRTGTFIVIDSVLEQIEKEQVVDIPLAITKIRQRRMKMVQGYEQFMFIHDAILESVTCGDTQIPAINLKANIAIMKKKDAQDQPHGFKYQFKILDQVSPNPEEVLCGGSLSYPERSRSDKFLPADRWRVILKGEKDNFIHAVNINGYKHKRAFIVAEGPMQSTVRNFWKMVYERNCAVIVMTSDLIEGGQEASAQYWPDSGIEHYGEFVVDLLGEEKLEGFTIRKLSIIDNKTQKSHQVTQFHITCWNPDGHCSNLKSVTDVIEEMTKVQIRSGNKPIVVHCSDTVTRSGMFCAIATTIERCKTEGVVDVFQVVKALRVQKPGAVPTVDQFKQIFEAVLVFLDAFDAYANFQLI